MANYDVKGYIKDNSNYYFKDATARSRITTLEGKVGDISTTGVTGSSVAAQITALNGKIPTTLASLTADSTHRLVTDAQITAWNNKVDKVTGKGLSTNDFTNALLTKLNGIATGAEVNVQSDWNMTDSSNDGFIKHKPSLYQNTYGVYLTGTDDYVIVIIHILQNTSALQIKTIENFWVVLKNAGYYNSSSSYSVYSLDGQGILCPAFGYMNGSIGDSLFTGVFALPNYGIELCHYHNLAGGDLVTNTISIGRGGSYSYQLGRAWSRKIF